MFDGEYASSTWRQFNQVVQIAEDPGISPCCRLLFTFSKRFSITRVTRGTRLSSQKIVSRLSTFVESSLRPMANKTTRVLSHSDRLSLLKSSPSTRKFRSNWIEIVEIGIVGIRVASSMLFTENYFDSMRYDLKMDGISACMVNKIILLGVE